MVISAETRAAIDAQIQKYPQRRGALLPALHLVQKEKGWIAPEPPASSPRSSRSSRSKSSRS